MMQPTPPSTTPTPAPALPVITEPEVETIFNRPYIVTINGLVRLLCMVLASTSFICSSVWNAHGDNPPAAGWVIFVSVSSLIMSLVFYLFHFFHIYPKLLKATPQWLVVELVAHILYTTMYLVCGILAAVYSAEHPATAAACFFAYGCMVAYSVEAFFSYQAFRSYHPPAMPAVPRPPVTSSGAASQQMPPATADTTGSSANPTYAY